MNSIKLNEIIKLYREVVKEGTIGYDYFGVKRAFERGEFLYEKNEHLKGVLIFKRKKDKVLIYKLFVDKNYRNQGIASKLIKQVVENYKHVYVKCYPELVGFYSKNGFEIISEGVKKGRKFFLMRYKHDKKI